LWVYQKGRKGKMEISIENIKQPRVTNEMSNDMKGRDWREKLGLIHLTSSKKRGGSKKKKGKKGVLGENRSLPIILSQQKRATKSKKLKTKKRQKRAVFISLRYGGKRVKAVPFTNAKASPE